MEQEGKTREQLFEELESLKKKVQGLEDAIIQTEGLEETLHVKGELYRRLVDISPDAIILVDLEGKIILANRRAAQLYGADGIEHMIGKNAVEFAVGSDKERMKENISRIIAEGSQRNVEYTLLKKDGSFFYGEISASSVFDANGSPQAIIAMVRDISARKKALNELNTYCSLLTATLESTADGILVIDRDRKISSYNQKFTQMWRIPDEVMQTGRDADAIGFVLEQLKEPEKFLEKVNHLYEHPEEDSFDTLEFKDGRIFERYSHPQRIAGLVAGRVWSFRDVTERKKALEQARKDKQFFSNIFSSIQDGISILDTDYTIVSVNATMEKWYEHAMPLVGKKCFQAYHCMDQQCEVCPTRETIEDKRVSVHTVPKRGPEGKITGWLNLYSFPLLDEHTGELAGVIEYVRDITEQKEIEEALKGSERQHRAIIESMQDPIHVIDPDMRIVIFNSAFKCWCQDLGLEGDFVGKSIREVFPFLPEKVYQEYRSVFTKKEVLVTEEKISVQGRQIFTNTQKVPIIEKGTVVQVITVVKDITDIKESEEELAVLNKKISSVNRRLKQLALKDHHTGLYNHNYLNEVLEREFSRVKRYAHPLSLIMFDIDYFKSINNVYGHAFGDLILKQFSRQLKKLVRGCDIVVRFGGEEFIIVSPGIEKEKAVLIARRIMNAINLYNFGDKKQVIKLKLSGSVVSYPEDKILSSGDFIKLADYILNKAKEDGGDRIYSQADVQKKSKGAAARPESAEELKTLHKKLNKLTKQANRSLIEAIFAFAKTITVKDHYTGEHVERTVYYATELARGLGLTKDEVELVKQASILHDLGKIGISEKILLKKSKLNRKEFNSIKKHPQIGVDIIRPIQVLHRIIPLIFYHHERWNGKGYPNGLKGEEIPIGARIIAVADAFQALISNRPYRRKAYTKEEAIRIIRKSAGVDFDPAIVNLFLKILKKEKGK